MLSKVLLYIPPEPLSGEVEVKTDSIVRALVEQGADRSWRSLGIQGGDSRSAFIIQYIPQEYTLIVFNVTGRRIPWVEEVKNTIDPSYRDRVIVVGEDVPLDLLAILACLNQK